MLNAVTTFQALFDFSTLFVTVENNYFLLETHSLGSCDTRLAVLLSPAVDNSLFPLTLLGPFDHVSLSLESA